MADQNSPIDPDESANFWFGAVCLCAACFIGTVFFFIL